MTPSLERQEREENNMGAKTLSLRGPIIRATVAVTLITVASLQIMGFFWEKKGFFFHGIDSEDAFQSVQRAALARQVTTAVQHVLVLTLSEDGSCRYTANTRFAAPAGERTARFPWDNAFDQNTRLLWKDKEPLEYRQTRAPWGYWVTVRLPAAAREGDTLTLSYQGVNPSSACRRDDENWQFVAKTQFGPAAVKLILTVLLPEGATAIHVLPPPASRGAENDRVAITFERNLKKDEAFGCEIIYAMP
ncbi:MAG: hypothetical protein NTW86_26460 [Candidatus Sumerlaeota bacterium]|nr:hypothetical protein [Candidatus Sumerlaeota bacterium]